MIITLHHVPVNVLEGVIRIMTGNSWSRSQDSLWEFLTEMICMKWKHRSSHNLQCIEIYDEHHLYNIYMYRYINWPVLYLNASLHCHISCTDLSFCISLGFFQYVLLHQLKQWDRHKFQSLYHCVQTSNIFEVYCGNYFFKS